MLLAQKAVTIKMCLTHARDMQVGYLYVDIIHEGNLRVTFCISLLQSDKEAFC